MSRTEVRQDTPVPGTHLTELELQEIWYQELDKIDPTQRHRKNKLLFPRSRRDLIQRYTEKSLAK